VIVWETPNPNIVWLQRAVVTEVPTHEGYDHAHHPDHCHYHYNRQGLPLGQQTT